SDIICICALHDHGWPPVNRGVPHLAGLFIVGVLGTHYVALDGTLQSPNVLVESRCQELSSDSVIEFVRLNYVSDSPIPCTSEAALSRNGSCISIASKTVAI